MDTESKDIELYDIDLECVDCGIAFTWSVGEQLFWKKYRVPEPPKRCKGCRLAKKQRFEGLGLA